VWWQALTEPTETFGSKEGIGGCCRENGRGVHKSHERQAEDAAFERRRKQALSGDGEGEGKPMQGERRCFIERRARVMQRCP
jgi:hypothetical protein